LSIKAKIAQAKEARVIKPIELVARLFVDRHVKKVMGVWRLPDRARPLAKSSYKRRRPGRRTYGRTTSVAFVHTWAAVTMNRASAIASKNPLPSWRVVLFALAMIAIVDEATFSGTALTAWATNSLCGIVKLPALVFDQ
jgi:hypothetical protein